LSPTSPTSNSSPTSRLAAFRSGIGTNLLNPKAGVFYMSLLPQFIPHGAPVFGTTLLLTAIDVAELSLLYLAVSGAAAALAHRLGKASFKRRMEQVSGVVFLGFAVSLVFERS
jgi:threonine/homoserine/homoserine lactone efflux protein